MGERQGAGEGEEEAVSSDRETGVKEGAGVGERERERRDRVAGNLFHQDSAGFIHQDEVYDQSMCEMSEKRSGSRGRMRLHRDGASQCVGEQLTEDCLVVCTVLHYTAEEFQPHVLNKAEFERRERTARVTLGQTQKLEEVWPEMAPPLPTEPVLGWAPVASKICQKCQQGTGSG